MNVMSQKWIAACRAIVRSLPSKSRSVMLLLMSVVSSENAQGHKVINEATPHSSSIFSHVMLPALALKLSSLASLTIVGLLLAPIIHAMKVGGSRLPIRS